MAGNARFTAVTATLITSAHDAAIPSATQARGSIRSVSCVAMASPVARGAPDGRSPGERSASERRGAAVRTS
jgi:hypothetical protein